LRAKATVIALLLLLAVIGVSSSRQVAAETRTVEFPREYDSWHLTTYPYWYVIGDSVNGTREIDITKVNKADIHLELEYNTASDTWPHVFDVSLNGISVGTFSVKGLDGYKIDRTVSFAPIDTHGSVEIRYKLAQCAAYSGVIIIANGSSTLALSDGPPKTKKELTLQALGNLEELRDSVKGSGIDQGPKHSLLSKLDRAIAKVDQALVYIDKGNEQKANKKLSLAVNSIVSFVKAVDSFSERMAPYGEGWRVDAGVIIGLIETAIETPL